MRFLSALIVFLTGSAIGCAGDADRARLAETTRATYDTETGRLQLLTFDADGNGVIDTWTHMDGSRAVFTEIDANENGRVERWEYYGADGTVEKVALSRADDGTADAWLYPGSDGRPARAEIASKPFGPLDRWEWYRDDVLVRAEEDADGDGRVDKWETYRDGTVASVAFDEDGDGRPDRRLNYGAGGALLSIESDPGPEGEFRKKVEVGRR